MDGPSNRHSYRSKSDRESDICYHIYVESKKEIQMNLFTKQKQTHRHRKKTYCYQRGKKEGRDRLGVWD